MTGEPQPPASPPDPIVALQSQLQALQSQPTWDDAVQLMREDGPRGFRIDIETDSTISGDILAEQQGMTDLLEGITKFVSGIAPAVEAGALPLEAAKAMLLAAVRRFRMGKQVEDAVDQIGSGQPNQPKVDPRVAQAQAEIAFKQQNLEFEKQQAEADAALKTRQMQLDERSMTLKEQEQEQRSAMEGKKLDLEHARESQRIDLDGLKQAHDMAATNAQNHLAGLQAMSEHLGGIADNHLARMKAASDHMNGTLDRAQKFVAGKDVTVHRDPKTNRIVRLRIESPPEAPSTSTVQ